MVQFSTTLTKHPFQNPRVGYIATALGLSFLSFGVINCWWRHRAPIDKLTQTERRTLLQKTEVQKQEIDDLQIILKDLRLENRGKDDELAALKASLESVTEEIKELRDELEESEAANLKQNREIEVSEAENRSIRRQADELELRYNQTCDLLAIRTTELKAAHIFLNKADQHSGADIITMVEALNEDILQIAALVSDSFVVPTKNGDTDLSKAGVQSSARRVAEILSPEFVALLVKYEHEEDPIIVQMAFQAGLCAYSERMASSWSLGDPKHTKVLTDIYEQVRKSGVLTFLIIEMRHLNFFFVLPSVQLEEQAVSGRWRALTRVYAQRAQTTEPDLVHRFIEFFTHILITAGYDGTTESVQKELNDQFRNRLLEVVGLARRLSQAMGEGVTSCDLEINYVASNHPLEPVTMEDAWAKSTGAGEPDPDDRVLCTTDLGLNRIEKLPGKDKANISVLLKPKVVSLSNFTSEFSLGS